MLINSANLRNLYTSFSTAFQGAFNGVQPMYSRVSTVVPSSTRANEYGWMGQLPRIREWIGDRVVNNITTQGYTIRNRKFEMTIGVNRDDWDDDNLGIFAPLVSEMGQSAANFPDELVWPLLPAGFTTPCYDGQYFFDTDHPVLDALGNPVSVANTDGGNGTPWYLLDVSRVIKPFIFQNRRPFEFRRMDAATDEVVFNRDEYRYGVDGRCNAGYSFWQLAWGSKQPLDAAHYEAARVGLATMTGDYGRPLAIRGNLLVVPPSLEAAARTLLFSDKNANGADNIWKGSAELLVVPWLR